MKINASSWIMLLITWIIVGTLAACGGGASTDTGASSGGSAIDGSDSATGGGVPTMPPARFAQPTTQISVTSSDSITSTESISETEMLTESDETSAEPVDTPSPDADSELLARGEQTYARHCAECHGESGEGVADQGGALTDSALTESELSTLLRTGGDLGPEHLFGPQKISPGSLEALSHYVQTLASAE